MFIGDFEFRDIELSEILGEGADFQVFGAENVRTGTNLVIKRPHPVLVSRNEHQAVENRIRYSVKLRDLLGGCIPHVAELIGVSESGDNVKLFGDDLGNDYIFTVELRAEGIPLIGATVDALKRQPVGLPMNLFCLYPLRAHSIRGSTSIFMDVLETVESFYNAGVLLLDVRPQNVFYAPKTGNISIIDLGDLRKLGSITRKAPSLDINDMVLDLFSWYIPINDPPIIWDSWTQALGPQKSSIFEQAVDDIIGLFSADPLTEDKYVAIKILHRIKMRRYTTIHEFTLDVSELFRCRTNRLRADPKLSSQIQLWDKGLSTMYDLHWRKFLFHAESDLLNY